VSVKEIKDKVIFLRKLKPGGSEHSFGIHVAQMAGMPPIIISRAGEMMKRLEKSHSGDMLDGDRKASAKKGTKSDEDGMQLSFFQLDDPVLEQIRDEITGIDVNSLTPVEALMKLNEIKKLTGKN
jgi:DNA mismatch repair protein MutS